MIKVIICGGRDVTFTPNEPLGEALWRELTTRDVTHVIHGDARGADTHAALVAREMGLEISAVPAEWQKYGRAAGPIRNTRMLKMQPDFIFALPGGRGTANMCSQARAAGIPVIEVRA